MLEEVKYCNETFESHFDKPMIFTSEDDQKFKSATKYHIFDHGFIVIDSIVRGHDHFFSFSGGQHTKNVTYFFRFTDKIPVIVHNLRGYDSNLRLQQIGKFEKSINIIPNNMEKYLAFFLEKQLKFIDSYQFMNSSLEKLAKNFSLCDMKYSTRIFE